MAYQRLFFSVILVSLLVITAPVSGASKARYGLRIGINFATLHGDTEEVYGKAASKQGLCIGGHAEIDLNDFLFVQSEFLYDNKGAKSAENPAERVNLSYLTFPVLLKLKTPGDPVIRPSILFGLAANLLMNAEAQGENIDIDIKDLTTKIDGSLIFGVGLDIKGGTGHFVIEARYTMGLQTIDDQGDYDIRNRVFSILGGYTFK
jgi:hypothetical protein